MSKALTTEEFIKKANSIHNCKYDYSKTNYVNAHESVCIICPEHGEFWQKPYCHYTNGCPKCANIKRKLSKKTKKTTEEFINECVFIYGNKYDYSKVNYSTAHEKVCIIDRETGREIWITPTTLLTKGIGKRERNSTTDSFVKAAKKIHGDKYDYSDTLYINNKTKISYVCPKHGKIEQLPQNHLKYGCRFCSYEKYGDEKTSTKESFIERAKKIHGDKYDYNNVIYKRAHEKVCIICPEHGEFWQTPSKHLCGQGCPKCNDSKLEEEVALFLDKKGIKYEFQYAPSFLKNGRGVQKIDFYLPEYNVGIECQGIQHFVESKYQAKTLVEKNKKRDVTKYEKCKNNGLKILYYTTKDNIGFKKENIIYTEENIFDDIEKCLKVATNNKI